MSIRLFGSEGPLPQQHNLQAGPISLLFEHGALRRIRYGQHEVIRNIYFALRDQNWGTIPYRLHETAFSTDNTSFSIQFQAVHYHDGQDVFEWNATVSGQESGTITFELIGKALQPFWRNRAGFCVLHPIAECAGQPVTITEPSGQQTACVFPKTISPNSPFPTIQAMSWHISDGLSATIAMTGDSFETEDQRNWTDTSFKTYCTPQSLPMPVELLPGTVITQQIQLSFDGLPASPQPASGNSAITVQVSNEQWPMPALGTLEPFNGEYLTEAVADQVQPLKLDHYRADISLFAANWKEALNQAGQNADLIGAPLVLALTFSENPAREIDLLLAHLTNNPFVIQAIILFQQQAYATPTPLIQEAVSRVKKALPGVQIGAGVQTNYAEFGRNLFTPDGLDFVVFSVQPQAHAFDLSTIIENMEAQADAVFSAKTLYPNQAVYVSPLSLLSRFNPYARLEAERWIELPAEQQTDPRQFSYFGAGWALGSIKSLAEAGAASISLFRASGPAGLVADDGTSSAIWQLLCWIRHMAGATIRPTTSSDKLTVSTLLLEKDSKQCWLVANHTADPIQVQLPAAGPFSVESLSRQTRQVNGSLVEVGAFDVVRVW